MIQILVAIGGAALLFVAFALLQKSVQSRGDGASKRECFGCHCTEFCEKDGHRIGEVESHHAG
jgi:hypothetical protein